MTNVNVIVNVNVNFNATFNVTVTFDINVTFDVTVSFDVTVTFDANITFDFIVTFDVLSTFGQFPKERCFFQDDFPNPFICRLAAVPGPAESTPFRRMSFNDSVLEGEVLLCVVLC